MFASFFRMAFLLGVLAVLAVLAGCRLPITDDGRAELPIPVRLASAMKAKGMTAADPILIRIFKQESVLEVWKRDRTGLYALLASYPMCRWSGTLGPKSREGDRQAAEGFYAVGRAQMNPRSQYFLSFDLGYPNALERALGYTGEAIMVHGACTSSGCFAVSDRQVGEIYAIAREALRAGQGAFQVEVFPFRMTPENMARYRNDPNIGFWRNLEEGYDAFELTRQEPRVAACGRHYVFNVRAKNPADKLRPLAACPPFEPDADTQHIAHDQREEAETISLAASGRAGLPLAYVDGGMNQVFRKVLLQFGPERLAKQTSFQAVEVSRPSAALADPYLLGMADP